jgi:tetratricopeptide (TPR) repeat protein
MVLRQLSPSWLLSIAFAAALLVAGSVHAIATTADEVASEEHRSALLERLREEEPLTVGGYRDALRAFLHEDQSLASDDYRMWSDVALATRMLALATSPDLANEELDAIFDEFGTNKLRSHVWAFVPTGAIQRLGKGSYWRFDVYGPNTAYPKVRSDAEAFIANSPDDEFVEFAYFLLGDFEGGLLANPDSIIAHILHYAAGYGIVQALVDDALAEVEPSSPPSSEDEDEVDVGWLSAFDPSNTDPEEASEFNDVLEAVNSNPELFDNQPISVFVSDFSERAAIGEAHFAAVPPSTPLADDAAYMGAWLAFHDGELHDALSFAARGIGVGSRDPDYEFDGDYQHGIERLSLRTVAKIHQDEQVPAIRASGRLSLRGSPWYVVARAAYRQFDYARTMEVAREALGSLGIPVDQLPATTDPGPIGEAISRIDPRLNADLNAIELPYLLEAAREMASYEEALANIENEDAEVFSIRARQLVFKYSRLVDYFEDEAESTRPIQHQDFRQALHLIDATLESTHGNPAFENLVEWLYFRKVRILVQYDPALVAQTTALLAVEFPSSQLLDDALAEQVFALGFELDDVAGAEAAFQKLLELTPDGNAVDNGYNWMVLILCYAGGRAEDAKQLDFDLIKRFPLTRHALNASKRNFARCS